MIYTGPDLGAGNVALSAVDAEAVTASQPRPVEWGPWLERAITDDSIIYFSISVEGGLAGEIFVHDIARDGTEGMLGYHIFDTALRGRGVGTASLTLLLDWLRESTRIERLFVTTGEDNTASRRMPERAGMKWLGRPREGGPKVLYRWEKAPVT